MTADLTPSLREAADTLARWMTGPAVPPPHVDRAWRLLAGLVPGEGVEVRYGAENVRAYVDGIVAGLTGRQHYVAPLAAATPGDDRGRDLADDPRVDELVAALAGEWDRGLPGDQHRRGAPTYERARVLLARLDALAVPAETEAGGARRGRCRSCEQVHELVLTCHLAPAYGEGPECEGSDSTDFDLLAATPPSPAGEAGGESAPTGFDLGARVWSGLDGRRGEIVGAPPRMVWVRWDDDPLHKRNEALAGLHPANPKPAPAGPAAEGAGETGDDDGDAHAVTWTAGRWAALERDRRRFLNDPDRCQDCELVEACDCRGQWSAPSGAEDEAASGGGS